MAAEPFSGPVATPKGAWGTMLGAFPDTLLRLDENGVILDFHAGRDAPLLQAGASLIGTNIQATALPAAVTDQLLAALAAVLADGGSQSFDVALPGTTETQHYELRVVIVGAAEGLVIARKNGRHKAAEATLASLSQDRGQRVAERTHELTSLLQVMQEVTSTLELTPLLQLILDRLRTVIDYSGAAIFTLAGEGELELLLYHGPIPQAELRYRWPFAQDQVNAEVIRQRRPIIIPDVHADTPLARAYQATSGPHVQYVRTWMGVPLVVKDQVIGMLGFDHDQPNYYTAHLADLALAFASQAAIAIENARLYEQARLVASLEERQKLARELHDSVSQALYGIALGARTARALLDRDPAKVVEPLDYVLSLADAGLTEMRALIFELRPESLAAEGLVAALEKQSAAIQARYGIAMATTLTCEPTLGLTEKQALYRIAQEAMHNVVKHAQASQITLRLVCEAETLVLAIGDNGIGFAPTGDFPGHLGLRSMRERAERMGATLTITSAPGAGTAIAVRLPGAALNI